MPRHHVTASLPGDDMRVTPRVHQITNRRHVTPALLATGNRNRHPGGARPQSKGAYYGSVRLALLVLVAICGIAQAKPKAAVAPLDGDDDNKVAEAVATAAGSSAKVVGPE